MKKGTYIGPVESLKGKTAIVRQSGNSEIHVLAQFDDLKLDHHLTHGWQPFFAEHFDIKPSPFDCDGKHDLPRPTCACEPGKPYWPCPTHPLFAPDLVRVKANDGN